MPIRHTLASFNRAVTLGPLYQGQNSNKSTLGISYCRNVYCWTQSSTYWNDSTIIRDWVVRYSPPDKYSYKAWKKSFVWMNANIKMESICKATYGLAIHNDRHFVWFSCSIFLNVLSLIDNSNDFPSCLLAFLSGIKFRGCGNDRHLFLVNMTCI